MQKLNGQVSFQAVLMINDLIIEHLKNDYISILRHDRQLKLQLIDYLEDYIEHFKKQQEMLDNIMEQATDNILKEVGISVLEFESMAKYISDQNPQFQYMAL